MKYNENPVEIAGKRIEDKSTNIDFKTNDDLSDKRITLKENNKSSIEKNNLSRVSRKKHPIIMILEFMIILIFIQFCITHAGDVLSDLFSKIN